MNFCDELHFDINVLEKKTKDLEHHTVIIQYNHIRFGKDWLLLKEALLIDKMLSHTIPWNTELFHALNGRLIQKTVLLPY